MPTNEIKQRIQQLKKAATGYRDAHEQFLKGKIERGEYYVEEVRFEAEANLGNALALIAELERLEREVERLRRGNRIDD